MKNKKTENKESSPNNNNGRYLIAGIITAIILATVFYYLNGRTNDSDNQSSNKVHVWSPGADSLFVKNCYDKYKPQIKDDFEKQELMKTFCRCMLEKVKSKYDEKDLDKVTDKEIKAWDSECREGIFTPPQQ